MDYNVHNVPIGIAHLTDGHIRYMNEAFKELNRLDNADVSAASWLSIATSTGQQRIVDVLQELTTSGAHWTGRIRTAGGTSQAQLNCSISRIGEHEYLMTVSRAADVWPHSFVFANAEEWTCMKDLLLGSVDALWRWDLTTDRLHIEGDLLQEFGVPGDRYELPMEQFVERIDTEDLRSAEAAYERMLRNEEQYFESVVRLRHDDGHYLLFDVKGRFVAWKDGGQTAVMAGTAVRHETTTHRHQTDDSKGLLELIADAQATFISTGEIVPSVGRLLRAAVQHTAADVGILLECTSSDLGTCTYRELVRSLRCDNQATSVAVEAWYDLPISFLQKDSNKRIVNNVDAETSLVVHRLMSDTSTACTFQSTPLFGTMGCVGVMILISYQEDDTPEPATIGLQALSATMAAMLDVARRKDGATSTHPRLTPGPTSKLDTHSGLALNNALASISHDLRQPLAAMLSITETMSAGVYGPLSSEQTNHLGAIHDDGMYMSSLIDDLLDVTKARQHELTIQLQQCDVVSVLADSLEVLRPLAETKHQVLHFASSVPSGTMVQADPRRLKQIVLNIVGNAIRFTPTWGEISVDVCYPPDGSCVDVRVRDTGIGVEAKALPEMFDAFGQQAAAPRDPNTSTGLGLSIAQHLVDMHGGVIEVDSTPGVGTTFTISLPIPEPRNSRPVPSIDDDDGATEVASRPVEIILIDGNTLRRSRLEAALQQDGHGVRSYASFEEALNLRPDDDPHLVVVNIHRVDETALELIRQLRTMFTTTDHKLAILVLSGMVMPGDVHIVREAGAANLLSVSASTSEVRRTAAAIRSARATATSD
ncbi:MAG: hybrid sensor histidine kinase/response regulator [Candidatus Kapabacteria bacterium]|nr:hybrid sensor histidine kinase/response regulator [Candidatus Kapabacteria bacterium]